MNFWGAAAVGNFVVFAPYNADVVGVYNAPCVCTDMCHNHGTDVTSDSDCDDGGPGNEFALCDLGSDCTDCGVRCSYSYTTVSTGS
eukprot:441410-Prymnesium_polylepis.1